MTSQLIRVRTAVTGHPRVVGSTRAACPSRPSCSSATGETVASVREAGAVVAVAGGAIGGADDPSAAAEAIREAIEG